MDRNEFDKFFQERADAEEASKRALLNAVEKANPAGDTLKNLHDISEDLAAKLSNMLKIGRSLSVEQLAQRVKEAFQAVCQANNVAGSLSEIATSDDGGRQDLWSRTAAAVDIKTIAGSWLENEKDFSTDERVLEEARQYAQRVLDLTIAFNLDWDGGPAFVVHQFKQENET
ncbi:hypothetical protein HYV57_00685 [Candidatus Peregrinibacteria bacterium]|nr:hypothetical protein [Candidatus Peregrinibacteria bacterium]